MQKRQWIISILLTLLIFISSSFVFKYISSQKESTISSDKPAEELRKIQVSTFPPATIKNKIEIDGRINAFEKINIAAEVQGKLLSTGKSMKSGTSFAEGDLLFKIDNTDDLYSLKALRSQLFTAVTQIMPDLKFDYPLAFENWKKYLDQFDLDSTTKTLPLHASQQEKYFIGGKNIWNLYYTIKSQEERLKQYAIYAPFSGVFLSVSSYPGSMVSPGVPLAQLMNTSKYEMVSPISAQNLSFIKIGQKVELQSEEMGKTFYGTLSRTSKQIDPSTQSIPLYITVRGAGLRDGMYLKGVISGKNIDGLSTIPKDIIINQNQVYIYQDSTISKKEIQLHSIEENSALVRGLTASDQIIISSVNNLYAGQKVAL